MAKSKAKASHAGTHRKTKSKKHSAGMKMPKIDKESLLASHKKNLETFAEAHKRAKEHLDNISNLHKQYLKETFEDMRTTMQNLMQHPTSLEAWQKHSEKMRNHVSRSLKHGSDITETLKKTHHSLHDIMNKRIHDGMKELKEIHQKSAHH